MASSANAGRAVVHDQLEEYPSEEENGHGGGHARRPRPSARIDDEYDYGAHDEAEEEEAYRRGVARQEEEQQEQYSHGHGGYDNDGDGQQQYEAEGGDHGGGGGGGGDTVTTSADEAILDLVELEQLQAEAERMKGLGNKHMSAQEYTRAYNAYSAALQLSPVGPSSHVFLSNRAASLLSLKRYSAAAVDARRAVALAPTFGKAHARLGQSLYFLKDYAGAVAAYEEAVKYEPDNAVTWTYLAKAKSKLAKTEESKKKKERGEEISVAEESTHHTVINSIATDPNNVGVAGGLHSSGTRLREAAGGEMPRNPPPSEMASTLPPMSVETGPMGGPAQRKPEPYSLHLSSPMAQGSQYAQQDVDAEGGEEGYEDDPDFEEALRRQRRASHLLSIKQYRSAVDEYSAALFLVPDDPLLSPQLHIGRAHALNGQQRHESARNDARMALQLQPDSSEAYSVLAKSQFYAKDYEGAVEAFESCERCLEPGEELSVFDRAYLQKAREALHEEEMKNQSNGDKKKRGLVPKLKPPRFVSREEMISSTPNLPPMPKAWPQQSPHSPTGLRVGPEREVTFLSDSMGIKLNRGGDGIVRVLSVTPQSAGSPIIREGHIEVGDVLREAAGVDIRRPITNIMWGDTVALMKMAPRPITIIVAKEMAGPADADTFPGSPVSSPTAREAKQEEGASFQTPPHSALTRPSPACGEESVAAIVAAEDEWDLMLLNEAAQSGMELPSPANGEESVAASIAAATEILNGSSSVGGGDVDTESDGALESGEGGTHEADNVGTTTAEEGGEKTNFIDKENAEDTPVSTEVRGENVTDGAEPTEMDEEGVLSDSNEEAGPKTQVDGGVIGEESKTSAEEAPPPPPPSLEQHQRVSSTPIGSPNKDLSQRDIEIQALEGEILFEDISRLLDSGDDRAETKKNPPHAWTNERWLATSSDRILRHCGLVTRLTTGRFFFSGDQYVPRTLALFENPALILVLRLPKDVEEVRRLLPLPPDLDIGGYEAKTELIESFLVAESVIDPKTCKLKLSPLTTATSITSPITSPKGASPRRTSNKKDPRRRTCFELVTPIETIYLSAVVSKDEAKKDQSERISYTDSRAFLETTCWEVAIGKALKAAHEPGREDVPPGATEPDQAWKHQIVLGTLHSYVVSGNDAMLKEAIDSALEMKRPSNGTHDQASADHVDPAIIDATDESGKTALHYACSRRSSSSVSILVNAGANGTLPTLADKKSPCHLCAEGLDEKSLSTILAAGYPERPDPNTLDIHGRTSMYVASVEGRAVGGISDPIALGLCLSALEAWGGVMLVPDGSVASKKLLHPAHCVAAQWRASELAVVLSHCQYYYPLVTADGKEATGISVSALFHYPLHAALISLRRRVMLTCQDGANHGFDGDSIISEPALVSTLRVLLEHGFEPNERLEGMVGGDDHREELAEMFGFTPLQILAAAAQEAQDGGIPVKAGDELMRNIMEIIESSADILIRNGARTTVDPPPETRLHRESSSGSLSQLSLQRKTSSDSEHGGTIFPAVDRASLRIDGNARLMNLLGGEERLNASKTQWTMMLKSVNATGAIALEKQKSNVGGSEAPGGSDEKTCAICWNPFGMVMNRKHTCRVSQRYVCDDCSTKRVVDHGEEYRVTDGQFLLARIEAEKENTEDRMRQQEENRQRRLRVAQAQAAKYRTEKSAKDDLFGEVGRSMKNFIMGEEESEKEASPANVASAVNGAKDALNERGAKLNSLSDKTEALKNASVDFANMAKELEQQQKGFW